MEESLKRFVEQMVREIATSLGSLYLGEAYTKTTRRLIFPEQRQGIIRVSEQESKILLCRYLDNSEYIYSVETPTSETYKQKGKRNLSARIDLTLYDLHEGKPRRVLNLELKAHNCKDESIRKDLEKLIRENTDGVWFHTLERADRGTFRSLFSKFVRSFQKLKVHYKNSDQAYLFAFCTLDPNFVLWHWVSFNGNDSHNTREIESAFGDEGETLVGWKILNLTTGEESSDFLSGTRPRKGAPVSPNVSGGARAASLILAPEINPRSFLHLSTRGSSYFLRDYSETGPDLPPTKFRWKGCPKLEELRRTVRVSKEVEPTAEDMKMNIDKRPEYWFRRIQSINKAHLS